MYPRSGFAKMVLLLLCLAAFGCSKKFSPEKPVLTGLSSQLDSLPLSDIDIPVRIPLTSFRAMAEEAVDPVYTSPGWPLDYVVDDCETRYMYRFRRGPLQMKAEDNQIRLSFTAYYQIAGSQRLCAGSGSNRTPITPWSPPCTCGLGSEGERKVNVSFNARLALKKDYSTDVNIQALQPVPVDKCTVCFWSQDITGIVMTQLKGQLEEARRSMLDTIRALNLRPQFQRFWNILNTPQPVYGQGYLQINPERIRISRLITYKDTIFLTAGISARPVVSQVKMAGQTALLPDISDFTPRSGFNLYVDARLNYDSLSNLMTAKLAQKRIDLEQGGRHIIVERCAIYGGDREKLILKVDFTGSNSGSFYLTGKPVYNAADKVLSIEKLEFDIRSKDLMVKTVSWMFNRKILNTLQAYTRFNTASYEQDILGRMNAQMNRTLYPGVQMTGYVREISLEKIYTFQDMLVVRFHSSGKVELLMNQVQGF